MMTFRKRRRALDYATFLVFVLPNAALFLLFTYWPIVQAVYTSFTSATLLPSSAEWVGLENYVSLVNDEQFWRVIFNTFAFAVAVVVIAQTLAFFLALLLNHPIPGRPLFRILSFMPYVTTPAAAALIWIVLLDPEAGPLSFAYDALYIAGPRWLSSTILALCALIVVGIWKEIGFASLFLLAGFQSLPCECYEAARLETSSRCTILWRITIPLMRPVMFFLAVSGLIAAFKTFDIVAIMTEGGPVYPSSSTYVYHLYHLAFQRFELGKAMAFSMFFFAVMIGATVLQFVLARRRIHYGE